MSAIGKAFKTAAPHLLKAAVSGTKVGVKEGVKAGTKNLVKEHGAPLLRNARSAVARIGATPAMLAAAAGVSPVTSVGLSGSTPYMSLPEPFPRHCSCNYTAVAEHPQSHPADPRDDRHSTHRIMKCDSCAPFGLGPMQYLGKLRAEMPRRNLPSRKANEKRGGARKTRRKRQTRRLRRYR